MPSVGNRLDFLEDALPRRFRFFERSGVRYELIELREMELILLTVLCLFLEPTVLSHDVLCTGEPHVLG